jgi:hypothetical protein
MVPKNSFLSPGGERIKVRGDKLKSQQIPPHPNPLPQRFWGEGKIPDVLWWDSWMTNPIWKILRKI